MKLKAKIQVVAATVVVALANMSVGAHGALQQPQSRSGTTYYRNANGSSAGRATTVGNTTYYYNANGLSTGRSTRVGNTTYYYYADGSSAGMSTAPSR